MSERTSFSLAWHLGFCLELRGPNCGQTILPPLRASPGSTVAASRANLALASQQVISPQLVGWLVWGEARQVGAY